MSTFRNSDPRGLGPITALNAGPMPTKSSFEAGAIEGGKPSGTALDPAIEVLDLAPVARAAAYALKRAHPAVKFTSGRRNKDDQARAMASNVVGNRKWIEQTYASSTLRTKLQDWVNAHPDKTSKQDIETGILLVFDTASDAELAKFSRHLGGMAFDVQPVMLDAEKIKATIRHLDGLDKFLDSEGGLVRWHAQF